MFDVLSPFPSFIYSEFQVHAMVLLTFGAGLLPPQLGLSGKIPLRGTLSYQCSKGFFIFKL